MTRIAIDKRHPTLADEPIKICLIGLTPFQKVTLHAFTDNENGAAFESLAQYQANCEGCVSLSTSESLGGTYQGVWEMGIFSSMIPSVSNKRKHERFLIKNPMKPFSVRLRLYDDFVGNLDVKRSLDSQRILAEAEVVRTYAAPQVREEEIRVGRIRGTLYYHKDGVRRPGVISISGAYPGAMKHKASLLASRGFVALALRYFGTDDLPPNTRRVDLSYFEEASFFLKHHPRVDGTNGIGIIANCIAASLALSVAACTPKGLVGCAVVVSGWFMPYTTYTYKGKEMNLPNELTTGVRKGPSESIIVESVFLDIDGWKKTANGVPDFYKRLSTAYMFVYGGQDPYVPQTREIGEIGRTLLSRAGHRRYKFLYYPKAGHLLEHAFHPHTEILRMDGIYQYQGGTRPEHNLAQENSWPEILRFTRENLAAPKSKL